MLFLGIDPGVRKCGFALIDENKRIIQAGILVDDDPETRKRAITRPHYRERLCQITDFFENLFTTYTGQIKACGIEKLFFTAQNQQNAEFVYGMRGIVCMLATKQGIPLVELTPPQLKKAITGNARANKELIQRMIMRRFGLEHKPEYHDAADALGLALVAGM